MICPKCGTVLQNDARRCYECGESFQPNPSQVSQQNPFRSIFSEDEDLNRRIAERRVRAIEPLSKMRKYQFAMIVLYIVQILILLKVVSMLKDYMNNLDSDIVGSIETLRVFSALITITLAVFCVLFIIELGKLGDSNENFVKAFKFMLISIAVAVVGNLLGSSSFDWMFSLAKVIFNFLYIYYLCKGSSELCLPENPTLSDRWELFWKFNIVLSVVVAVVSAIIAVSAISGSGLDAIYTAILAAERLLIVATIVDTITSLIIIYLIGETVKVLETVHYSPTGNDTKSIDMY